MFNNEPSFQDFPDLYKILECSEDASPDAIKKQYRRMSLAHHPDKNIGDPSAEEKFKSINMAYEVLSDPAKKLKYDNRNNRHPSNNPAGMGSNVNGNMDDIIKMFFNSTNSNPFANGGGRFPFSVNMSGGGNAPNVQIFRNGRPVHVHSQQQPGKPPVIQIQKTISFDTSYNGGQIPVDIDRFVSTVENVEEAGEGVKDTRKTEQETVYVEIPKGIDNNEIITIEGKGNIQNETMGDVKVIIKVDRHSDFIRDGLNLVYVKTITFKESICGFESIIRHVSGKQLRYKSEPGQIVKDGTTKTIQGLGMMRNHHVGNLIVKLHIDYSNKLTIDQLNKLREIL